MVSLEAETHLTWTEQEIPSLSSTFSIFFYMMEQQKRRHKKAVRLKCRGPQVWRGLRWVRILFNDRNLKVRKVNFSLSCTAN